MIKKNKIMIIISLLIFIVIIVVFGIYMSVQKNATEDLEILEDLDYLFDSIESTHPAFFLDEVPKEYYKEKENLQKNSFDIEENPETFKFKISRLLSTFNDLHTKMENSTFENSYLNTKLYYQKDKLRLVEGEKITDFYLTKINEIPISEVLEFIEETFPKENASAKAIIFEDYSRNIDVLKYLGVNIKKDVNLTFININDNKVKTIDSKFKSKQFKSLSYTMQCILIDDIILLDINSFALDDDFEKSTKLLKKYIGEGYTKVLIDVTNCPGGNSGVTDEVFRILNITGPDVGVYYPASKKLMEEQSKFYDEDTLSSLLNHGFWEVKPSYEHVKANDEIDLAIIINKYSASSSMNMAVRIQDGKLGTVIGEVSYNAPNLYGDNGFFSLPNSKIDYTVSLKKWFRPNQNRSVDELIPDILTNYNDDIYDIAVDFLNVN